jgi:type IV pilus assembly protein PilY1
LKRPDNFFIAGQASEMVENLKEAFDRIVNDIRGSGASLASVSSKLTTGSRIYQTVYFSRSWNGDIHAFDINPVSGKFSTTATWKASQQLPAWSLRNIHMRNDMLFRWSSLNSTEQTALGSSAIVDYLRGDASNEQKNGGTLRNRASPLGDMIQSQAVIVGKPDDNLYVGKSFSGAAEHKDFAAAKSGRTGTLYVGGNDGMLHGFNAQTGAETYAFIPSTTLPAMRDLANKAYEHRYYVDGEVTAADIYTQGEWKTILLATLGRGGKAIFALDVTDPEHVEFLWEKNATQIPALGNNLGKPLIAQTADGTWQAVLGNGMNSTGDKAQLIMINIDTAAVTVADTGVGGNNGLTAVAGWSAYGDSIATDFYAGDMNGNLWKFPADGSSSPLKLFTAKDKNGNPQPITAAPLSGKDPLTGKVWVFFGTGKYLAEADITTTATQTWYGLKDEGNLISRSNLLERKAQVEGVIAGYDVRVIQTGLASDLDEWKGWYIDLPTEGERMVVPNFFQADALVGTSRIPNGTDICTPTGKGFIMAISPFPGARLGRVFFDLSDDALFNDADKLVVDGTPTVVSGVGFGSSPHNPIFIDNLMQVVSDNGAIAGILTQGLSGVPNRTSWREILNQ